MQHEAWAQFAEGRNGLFSNEVLSAIGAKYEKSVDQVVLRWLIQRNVVVIPKSTHRERMIQNLDAFSFTLSDEDMQTIQTLDTGHTVFASHRDPAEIIRRSQFKIHD